MHRHPVSFHGNHHRDIAQLRAWTSLRHEEPLEPALPIVDAHHHLWDDERGRYLLDDEVRPVLEALIAAGNGRLRGIRHGATWDDGAAAHGRSFAPRHMVLDPAFQQGFAHLAPLGLSFDAWLFYAQLDDLLDLLD